MKKVALLALFIAFILSATGQKVNYEFQKVTTDSSSSDTIYLNISVAQADTLIQSHAEDPDFFILDVRTPEEYETGFIEGAININYFDSDFEAQLDSLEKDKIYLIHCKSGGRSGQAFNKMQNLNFKEVYNMLGGITAWVNAGYPVVLPTNITDPLARNVEVKIYPNPVKSNSSLEINDLPPGNYKLAFFTILGHQLDSRCIISDTQIQISTQRFTSGTYFYRLASADGILKTGKFIVE